MTAGRKPFPQRDGIERGASAADPMKAELPFAASTVARWSP